MFNRLLAGTAVLVLAGCVATEPPESSSSSSSLSENVSSSAQLSSSSLRSSSAPASVASSSSEVPISSSSSSSVVASVPAVSSSVASSAAADVNGDFELGKAVYNAQCVGCHNADGKGFGQDLTSMSVAEYPSFAALVAYNDTSMPLNNGPKCVDDCALNVTRYIVDFYQGISWAASSSSAGASSSQAPNVPAVQVPAKIESEDFVNFEDSTPENKGSCGDMSQPVDMQPKASGGGTCDVNWTDAGEWLEYRIKVANAERFDVYVSLASFAVGKTVTVSVAGQVVGTAAAPGKGWTSFEAVKVGSKQLSAGEHTVRITIDTGSLNVDYLELVKYVAEPPYIPTEAELQAGYKYWTESCDTCHGDKGEGTFTYPFEINLLAYTRGELIQKIYNDMPPNNSQVACDMACATNVADFMLHGYPGINEEPELGCATNPITDHPNTPIRLLTSAQYGKLVSQVFAPLGLNMNNLIPNGTFVDDKNATGFVSNTGITAAKDNVEKMIEMAETIGTRAGNNFGKLMTCGINEACVKNYIRSYGEQLYRAPLNTTQVNELATLFSANPNAKGVGHVTAAMLLAGSTVYQYETAVTERKLLKPREIAERMSFLIWGMPADKALLDKAASGALNTIAGIRTEAEAMLADPRAAEGLRTFYDDYLKIAADYKVIGHDSVQGGGDIPLGECSSTTQCKTMYAGATDCKNSAGGVCYCGTEVCAQMNGNGEAPSGADFTVTAKQISDDIMRFTNYLTRQTDGSFSDLMVSRKAFVDATMAKIYGVENAANNSGNTYLGGKEVTLPISERAGLLTRAGFSIYGSGEKVGLTSPTQRGEHVRKHILCQEPPAIPGDPPPFPDIPDPKEKTWVEVLKEIHLKDNDNDPTTPNTCVACHEAIDPVGFAFENYTLNGQYINAYPNGRAIDASGWLVSLNDGGKDYDDATFNDALELSEILASSDDAAACFAETWMSYALARTIVGSAEDSCAAEKLKDTFKNKNYSLKELIVGIVTNPAFRFRNPE